MSKASILLRRRLNVRQVALSENSGNEFVAHNLLHNKSHKLGAGDSALLCCLLQIFIVQRNDDIFDGHKCVPL
ncbi:hypothetical protein XH94_10920 [Bradyrhizobium zhanjiangense]|uniref:Uncharacterized protein n=1 Tax=Bradyrhizobium zhanjiangense TaxID=1325107 RepID=A0A4Q0SPS0_9BRAD|nr:hypothetical protein XH94_10920 [Bradyrhizobium zhanjiangense]